MHPPPPPPCKWLFLYLLIVTSALAWIAYHTLLFPPAETPTVTTAHGRAWPSSRAHPCGFRQRSRFAIASVLYGDQKRFFLFAKALRRSIVDDVDLILFGTATVPGWHTCPAAGLNGAYAKLLAWNLTSYEAVLVLDLDTLIINDIAPLFETWPAELRRRNALLGAAIDQPYRWSFRWTPADTRRFNAGVMLVLPSGDVFRWLVDGLANIDYDPRMKEQAYLNVAVGKRYAELPPTYNAMITTAYAEPRTWNGFVAEGIRIIHFTFPKPDSGLCDRHLVSGICQLWLDRVKPRQFSSNRPGRA